MMSRKRSESPVLAVIEGLSEGHQEDVGLPPHADALRDEQSVYSELAYIGQKAAGVAGKIAASLGREMAAKDILELMPDVRTRRNVSG